MATAPLVTADRQENGLLFRLSEGKPRPETEIVAEPARTDAAPLSDTDAHQILARLRTPDTEDESQPFTLPDSPVPPPAGATIAADFLSAPPAPIGPVPLPKASVKPLKILRAQPEGEVPLADRISITFSQPMVPMTAQDDAAQITPATLTPAVPGTWRWVGTQTLLFDPGSGSRLPMATSYRVTIPAGTRSAIGGVLAREFTLEFQTPAVRLLKQHLQNGSDSQPRDLLIWLLFDQRIDADAILQTVTLHAGEALYAVRRATNAEIAAETIPYGFNDATAEGRVVVVKPTELLPLGTTIMVKLGPNVPSVEGPRRTDTEENFVFATCQALKVVSSKSLKFSGNSWRLEFNNALDWESFDPASVIIAPDCPHCTISVWGRWLEFSGVTKGDIDYKVTIPATIKDKFGQSLGKVHTRRFKETPSLPSMRGPVEKFIVCDPAAPVRAVFHSINTPSARVRIYATEPDLWPYFVQFYHRQKRGDLAKEDLPPGRLIFDAIVPLETPPETWGETSLDIGPPPKVKPGNTIVYWESTVRHNAKQPLDSGCFWLQATTMGLLVQSDATDFYVWVTDLTTGKPIANSATRYIPNTQGPAETGQDGLAQLTYTRWSVDALFASHSNETAFLPASHWGKPSSDTLCWFVFDSQKLYRPGETVYVKGWLRAYLAHKWGELSCPAALREIVWQLFDANRKEVAHGVAPLTPLRGFDFTVELPETIDTGHAEIVINNEVGHPIDIYEFRRPQFEVTAKNDSGSYVAGNKGGADLSAIARYYSGGALSATPVKWKVRASAIDYSPPGHEEFIFGDYLEGSTSEEAYLGQTGSDGSHRIRLEVDAASRPVLFQAEAVLQDFDRQAYAAEVSLIVHPSERYIGLRRYSSFAERGQAHTIEAVVCGIDGVPDAGREVAFQAIRKTENVQKNSLKKESIVWACTAVSGSEPIFATFVPDESGVYTIKATVSDAQGRINTAERTLVVSGESRRVKREYGTKREPIVLLADKENYEPGETAAILVQSPISNAEGLVTVVRDGILDIRRFTVQGHMHTLYIPIEEAFLPGIGVQVELLGPALRTDKDGKSLKKLPPRPAQASGHIELSILLTSRRLNVAVTPTKSTAKPGESVLVKVHVTDTHNQPARHCETALVVVDEALLAQGGWQLGDPLDAFYPPREVTPEIDRLREFIALGNPVNVEARYFPPNRTRRGSSLPYQNKGSERLITAVFGEESLSNTRIVLRANFYALADFVPNVETDENGIAHVPVTLPDNLTRYRIVAVAVAKTSATQAGYGEAALTARLPLMARPSAPRFLNVGDRFELPVVLQNQTDEPLTVDVAVRGNDLVAVGVSGYRVAVPAQDRLEVRFPTEALAPGTARFQVVAVSGDLTDAAEVSLPIWVPATAETFATYGEIDQEGAIALPFQTPAEAMAAFGGLEVTTTSTALQELTDAFRYLAEYPYHCAEQVASRLMATAALRDILNAFAPAGEAVADTGEASVHRDLLLLSQMQKKDGGFGFWTRDSRPYVYLGVHAAHAISRTANNGFTVPPTLIERSTAYLKDIESKFDNDYSPEARRMIVAYALYVRHLNGDTDTARAKRLLGEAPLDNLGPETVGWLLNVLAGDPALAPARTWLNNKATETAAAAHFTFSYRDSNYLVLSSNRRADAIVLDGLIADQPKSDLIPKLVRGLLDGRVRGHWSGTQEDAFALLALDRYFGALTRSVTPDVRRAKCGSGRKRFAGESAVQGAHHRHGVSTHIPMAYSGRANPGRLSN